MADINDMMTKAKRLVKEYYNSRVENIDKAKLTEDEIFVVWFSETSPNWKALVSTTVSDDMYYEVTYDFDKKRTYIDTYKKWENVRVPDDK